MGDGRLEAFLQMEMVVAITDIKVIFTLTLGRKKRERRFFFFPPEANYFGMCHSTLKIY